MRWERARTANFLGKRTAELNEHRGNGERTGTHEQNNQLHILWSGSIDLKRFTDSGISLVECPDCGRMRSLSPVNGILRFKPHTRRKMQTEVKGKRWSTTGKTDWGETKA
jgi:hypothetical protein